MNPGKLPPIPTPFALRVRQARMTLLPGVVLMGSLLVIAILWRDRIEPAAMVGQADGATADSHSNQSGDLVGLRVEPLPQPGVREPLASVSLPDPKLAD